MTIPAQRIANRPIGSKSVYQTSIQTGNTVTEQFIYESAQVDDVIMNETHPQYNVSNGKSNVGRSRVRFTLTHKHVKSNELPYADPLIPNTSMFPLIGEYVLVFKLLNKYYYIGPINISGRVTQNANILESDLLEASKSKNKLKQQSLARLGVTTTLQKIRTTAGEDFKENNAKPIKSFEGDVIYQGRYGQSIRLGSSQIDASSIAQSPNIILRTGQAPNTSVTGLGNSAVTNESLNMDASSIWMVTNQSLPFVPATYGTNIHLRSLTTEKPIFSGAQILVNSDKVMLNAKKTSIFLFAKKGIHITSLDEGFTVDSAGQIILRTPNQINIYGEQSVSISSKEDIIVNAKRDVTISGDRNITIKGYEIFLGGRNSNASPIAMAKPLKLFLFEILRVFMSTSPLTLGPSGVMNPAVIARLLMAYAKYQVLPDPFQPLWASNDNFVLKTNERTLAANLPANEGYKNFLDTEQKTLGNFLKDTVNTINGKTVSEEMKKLQKYFGSSIASKI